MGDYAAAFYKIVVLGDVDSGKTTLVDRYVSNSFKDNFKPSIGVNFSKKIIPIDNSDSEDDIMALQLWDCSTVKGSHAINRAFYKKANAFILTFDLTKKEPFKDLNNYLTEINNAEREEGTESIKPPIYVMVTKNDLRKECVDCNKSKNCENCKQCDEYDEKLKQLKAFCEKNSFPEPIITSAKDDPNGNISKEFAKIGNQVHAKYTNAEAKTDVQSASNNGANKNVANDANKNTATETQARLTLIGALTNYIDYVNPDHKTDKDQIDFKFNFKYFRNRQARHRRQNYDFAVELRTALETRSAESLEKVLNDYLSNRLLSFNYATKNGHHINSNGVNGLNNAIREAKRAVDELKPAKKRPIRFC